MSVIGVYGHDNLAWNGFYSFGGVGISFKASKVPIFWNVRVGLKNQWFNIGIAGDYYFLDKTFVEEINMGWFLGIGAYAGFTNSSASSDKWSRFGGGIRVPVGLSWIYREKMEVFGTWIPSIGAAFWQNAGSHSGVYFPDGALTFEAGVRYWFK
jgi:hypothetical protein